LALLFVAGRETPKKSCYVSAATHDARASNRLLPFDPWYHVPRDMKRRIHPVFDEDHSQVNCTGFTESYAKFWERKTGSTIGAYWWKKEAANPDSLS